MVRWYLPQFTENHRGWFNKFLLKLSKAALKTNIMLQMPSAFERDAHEIFCLKNNIFKEDRRTAALNRRSEGCCNLINGRIIELKAP